MSKKNKYPKKDTFIPVDSTVSSFRSQDDLYESIITDMAIPESELTNARAMSISENKPKMEQFQKVIAQYEALQEKQVAKSTTGLPVPQWAAGTISGSAIASGTITSITYPTQTITGMGGQQYIVQGAPQYQYSTTTGTSAPVFSSGQWSTSAGYSHIVPGQMGQVARDDEIWVNDVFDFLEFFFDKAPVPTDRDKKYKHHTKINVMTFQKDYIQEASAILALKLPGKRIWVHDGTNMTTMPRRTHMVLSTIRNEVNHNDFELITEPMSSICKHCRMLINEHPTSPKNRDMHKCMFEPTYFTPLTPQDLA